MKASKPCSAFQAGVCHASVAWGLSVFLALMAALAVLAIALAFDFLISVPPLDTVLFLVGSILGSFASLRITRRIAKIPRPSACIIPSVATFAVLGLMVCAMDGYVDGLRGLLIALAHWLAFTAIFAYITRRGFLKMEQQQSTGFPVEPLVPAQPKPPQG